MKKKIWMPISVVIILLAILFVPIPKGSYDDGGTREYAALTYKIVDWKRIYMGGVYEKTSFYGPNDKNKSIDELWARESAKFGKIGELYNEEWLEKSELTKSERDMPAQSDVRITDIYGNCFFASSIVPMPYQMKFNGTLSADWCIGDQVLVTYENIYYDEQTNRMEADMLYIEESDFELQPGVAYKPVIYLYPEVETSVNVNLAIDGTLTCTYPAYNDGWTVSVLPDGTLTDAKGQTYNYLYWEGETFAEYDFSKGFCVKGVDTAAFLEDALEKLGLNRREANEFIVYWLPLMQGNPYNIIAFQSDAYTDAARLDVTPAPDTLIRVFMAYKASEEYIEIEAQELTSPEREGFTVIEWGGTEVK